MPESQDHGRRWLVTAAVLWQLQEAVPATDWLPSAPPANDPYPDEAARAIARRAILATYQPVLRECCEAISAWFERRELPANLSHPARFWIHRMAGYIAEFCDSHVCRLTETGETIIPYPDMPEIEVCSWLLCHWWTNVGLVKFVTQATTDQSLFYADNT